jgi:hypothetical protein
LHSRYSQMNCSLEHVMGETVHHCAGRITGTVGSSNETRESKGSWRSLGDIPRQGSSSPLSPGAATAGSRHGGGAHNACDDASGNDSSGRLDPPAACSAIDTEPRGSRNNPGTAGGMHDSKEVRVNRGDGTQHDQRNSDDSAALDGQSEARSRKDVVVLDVRNGYEWDAGHFQGAARPNEVAPFCPSVVSYLCSTACRREVS